MPPPQELPSPAPPLGKKKKRKSAAARSPPPPPDPLPPSVHIETEGRKRMALAAKKKKSVVVVVVILLFFSAASSLWFLHARSSRSSYGKIIQSTSWDDNFRFYVNFLHRRRGYQAYFVLLWKHPNMDDKDARRRWYESFLPSTLTDSGEPRLLYCYPFDVNGFLAVLTRAEALALASKPGIRRMSWTWNEKFTSSAASCGFDTRASSLKKKGMPSTSVVLSALAPSLCVMIRPGPVKHPLILLESPIFLSNAMALPTTGEVALLPSRLCASQSGLEAPQIGFAAVPTDLKLAAVDGCSDERCWKGDRVSRFPHTLCAPLLTLSCPSPLDLLPPSSSTTDSVLGWRCAEATVAESSPCQNLLSLPCQIASAVLPQVRLILPTTGRPASPSIPSPPPVSNQICSMASHRSLLPAALLLLLLAISSDASSDVHHHAPAARRRGHDAANEQDYRREAHLEPADEAGYRTYIVMLKRPKGKDMMDADAYRAWHQSFLPSKTTSLGEPRLRRSYRTVIHGFSARLTKEKPASELESGYNQVRILCRSALMTTADTVDNLGQRIQDEQLHTANAYKMLAVVSLATKKLKFCVVPSMSCASSSSCSPFLIRPQTDIPIQWDTSLREC
uniref:Inhibitor I9 domain-containing protein n=1 Tax=Leersia perrieri TaxID=77586 RepID=A0A0D9X3M0_9ORYZ